MKPLPIFSALMLCLFSGGVYAGNKLPLDPISGEAMYRQTLRLQNSLSQEDAFNLIQEWFTSGTSKFTCQSGNDLNLSCKNKAEVENAFCNNHPVQSLDPASGRIAGKGLIKYFGPVNSNISLLYMEYYLVLEIKGQNVTATVSKMSYHHYNQRTYTARPIFGWQGGRPFEPADKLENLVNSTNESRETQEVGNVVNQDIEVLFNDLKGFLQNKKALDAHAISPNLASETSTD